VPRCVRSSRSCWLWLPSGRGGALSSTRARPCAARSSATPVAGMPGQAPRTAVRARAVTGDGAAGGRRQPPALAGPTPRRDRRTATHRNRTRLRGAGGPDQRHRGPPGPGPDQGAHPRDHPLHKRFAQLDAAIPEPERDASGRCPHHRKRSGGLPAAAGVGGKEAATLGSWVGPLASRPCPVTMNLPSKVGRAVPGALAAAG